MRAVGAERGIVVRHPVLIKVVAAGASVLLLFLVAAVCLSVWEAGILPDQWLAVLGAVMLLIAVAVPLLFFRRCFSRCDAKGMRLLIAGLVIVLVTDVLCAGAVYAVKKLNETMDAISSETEAPAIDGKPAQYVGFGVYVRPDDPAGTLEDARNYVFAYADVDGSRTLDGCNGYIAEQIGVAPKAELYPSVTEMADSLLNGNCGAAVLNGMYTELLDDSEEYEDFTLNMKKIAEFSILVPVEDAVQTTAAPETTAAEPEEVIEIEPFAVYISGLDNRDKTLNAGRSDVNILAVVNPQTKQVLLVNTPRDYFVSNSAKGGRKDKLTHCGVYGITCSMDALAELYDVEIRYHMQINFSGFEALIDAIGGIDIYSDTAYTTHGKEVSIKEGWNHLNGREALGFVRERKALAGGDNDRGKHQMQAISAVVNKLTVGTLLMNYTDILDSMQDMFVTDMTTDEMALLVKMQLNDMARWNVLSYAATGSNGSEVTASAPGMVLYVMYPDEDSVALAAGLADRVLAGEILTEADLDPGAAVEEPAESSSGAGYAG